MPAPASRVPGLSGVTILTLKIVLILATAVLSMSCTPQISVKPDEKAQPQLAGKHYVSYDGDRFGYRNWKPGNEQQPHTVIIGVHGISGYSGDYQSLGEHLRAKHRGIALYAPETRGQGMDPNKQRIGDIRNKRVWIKDLYTFTDLVRKRHPRARIIWLGESMGSLIVMHAYQQTPLGSKKPDGMVLASPILDIYSKVPPWKYYTARVAAALLPKLRLSLESLSSGQRPVVTKDDIHEQQAAKNEWYVPRYTLRLLLTLGRMSDKMKDLASHVRCPVLVIHGGKDIFTEREKVERLSAHFPKDNPSSNLYYKESFHLLLYDHQRDRIFRDISKWLREKPKDTD